MQKLQNTPIDIKIKLSALWAGVTLLYIYCDYFELYVPGKTAGLVSGAHMLDSPLKLFFAGFLLALPACMIFLSVILSPYINRILNIGLGVFFTLIMLLILFDSFTPWRYFYVFYASLEVITTGLIVFYAIRWPKEA